MNSGIFCISLRMRYKINCNFFFYYQVFLKPDCSFYLGGRILEYVTEVFLYYNFSIKQFVETLKVIFNNL